MTGAASVNPKYSCVKCGSDGIQRVSALVHAGSWSGEGSSSTLAVGGVEGGGLFGAVAGTVTHQSGATALARLLAPPPEPQQPSNYVPGGMVALALVMFGSGAGAIISKSTDENVLAALLGVIAVVCLVLFPLTIIGFIGDQRVANQAYKNAAAVWPKQMQRWRELFYCARCHSVSNIDEQKAVAAEELTTLL